MTTQRPPSHSGPAWMGILHPDCALSSQLAQAVDTLPVLNRGFSSEEVTEAETWPSTRWPSGLPP